MGRQTNGKKNCFKSINSKIRLNQYSTYEFNDITTIYNSYSQDKPTLDVLTTLGIEKSEILRKMELLAKQLKQMQLEAEREQRNKVRLFEIVLIIIFHCLLIQYLFLYIR